MEKMCMIVKALGKRIIKLLIVLVLILFVLVAALGFYCNHIGVSPFAFLGVSSQSAAEETVEDILGIQDKTFESIKSLMSSAGINSTNRDILIALLASSKDQMEAIKNIAAQFEDNMISSQEAKEKLLKLLEQMKGN